MNNEQLDKIAREEAEKTSAKLTKVISSAVKKDGNVYLPASTFNSPTVCFDLGELKYCNF